MRESITITLESEERELVYNQLTARIQDFESMMVQAANKKNAERVIEIADVLKTLKSVTNKLLGD